MPSREQVEALVTLGPDGGHHKDMGRNLAQAASVRWVRPILKAKPGLLRSNIK
jgi:hypothetical protein